MIDSEDASGDRLELNLRLSLPVRLRLSGSLALAGSDSESLATC